MIVVAQLTEFARLPDVKHDGDAGMDFYSLEDYIIKPHSFQICRTGITVRFGKNFALQLWPKGRNDWLVGAGIIDSNYEGEILFKIFNVFDHDIVIRKWDALGQGVLVVIQKPDIKIEDIEYIDFNKTARGSTGGVVTELIAMNREEDQL